MSDYCSVSFNVRANRNLVKMQNKISHYVWDAIAIKEVPNSTFYVNNVPWMSVELVISELTLGESLDLLAQVKAKLNLTGGFFVNYGVI